MSKQLYNSGWEFCKTSLNSSQPSNTWQPVDIPHDWLIYDTTRLYASGIGWYRNKLTLRECTHEQTLQQYFLQFDGVYMDYTLFVNGVEVGSWKNGYTSSIFALGDFLHSGDNEILIKVMYQSPNSRWYTGAGIHRNVWLLTKPASYLITDGVYLWATPQDAIKPVQCGKSATLSSLRQNTPPAIWNLYAEVECWISPQDLNQEHSLRIELFDSQDTNTTQPIISRFVPIVVTSTTPASEPRKTTLHIPVKNPKLWNIDTPTLYTVRTTLLQERTELDTSEHGFGFRTFTCNSNTGLTINGIPTKIKGVCHHHNFGALGAAFNLNALQRQFTLLKAMGANAIRAAHSVPSPEFMQLADTMGFLVCSEAFDIWERSKTPYDYARFFPEWHEKDVASWVRRDRNHPSLLMWSLGNEVSDTNTFRGYELTKKLKSLVQQYDSQGNGIITLCSNYMPWKETQTCADLLQVVGYNYGERYYQEHHKQYPHWVIFGSETASIAQSRGIYHFPASEPILFDDDSQCSALGNSTTSWGAESWESCINDLNIPYSLGQFIWTGFDYLGEPTPYHTKSSYLGQIDTAGFPKDSFYVFQAGWTDYITHPMVHIFPYWSFNIGQTIDILVCSNAPEIELFFNGTSLGKKQLCKKGKTRIIGKWQLPYSHGTLKALAYNPQGKVIAEDRAASFGDPVAIVMTPHTYGNTSNQSQSTHVSDCADLCFIEISVCDDNGCGVENATNRIEVSVSGAGRLIGLDNGDSTDYDSFKGTSKRLFSGKLLAIVATTKARDSFSVTATSPDLQPAVFSQKASILDVSPTPTLTLKPTQHEIPLRAISLSTAATAQQRCLTPQSNSITVSAQLVPPNATYQEICWRATDKAGIDTPLVVMHAEESQCTLTAVADGEFKVRCISKNGREHGAIISELGFCNQGFGPAQFNPYKFISAGSHAYTKGVVSNGNERGIATDRNGSCCIGFTQLDFGRIGSRILHISLFVLDNDPFSFQIWNGKPEDSTSHIVGDLVYQKPSIWNVYQEESYQLNSTLKGMQSLYIVTHRKAHIKGFYFEKPSIPLLKYTVQDVSHIYGDSFVHTDTAIEQIGNNVTLTFDHLEIGTSTIVGIAIHGCSHSPGTPIQIQCKHAYGTDLYGMEFPYSDQYTWQTLTIPATQGIHAITLLFLPGSQFDCKAFRLIAE